LSSHRARLRSAWGKFLHLEAFTRLSQADQALIDRLLRKNVREAGARRDLVREGDKPRAMNVALEGWACRNKQLPTAAAKSSPFSIPATCATLTSLS
jgi:hypothetical protein